ncbi:MAG: restriction endonuclease subunit S [Syntrophales bacterium]|nr:restriction endonuclease subunit S [Syntrophales bacterium]
METKAHFPNWLSISLKDAALYLNGRGFKKHEWETSGLPIIRIQNLNNPDAPFNYTTKIFEDRYRVENGDLLFAWSASLGTYIWKGKRAWLNQHIFKITPFQGVEKSYLHYYLDKIVAELYSKTHGSGMVHITKGTFEKTSFLLPSPPEQKEIVARIEELFSELDNGIENLKKAREQLKTYRQAVLKYAFEGKLTEEWRARQSVEGNPPEPSDTLLERIRKEREEYYKKQVEDWKKACEQAVVEGRKKPAKPKKPKELPLLTEKELAELPALPEGWIYCLLECLGELERGKSKHRPRNDKKLFGGIYPFIQTGEVKAAHGEIKTYENTYNENGLAQSKLWPKGTLCITIAANIANTAFLGFDACFPDSIVGFTAYKPFIIPKYVDYFIQSTREKIEAFAPATAQKNINLTTLENLLIPCCGLSEQKTIVSEIESRLSVCDKLEQSIDESLKKAEVLRQSILKKAFEGELTKEWRKANPELISGENSAERLLERIKAEKRKSTPEKARK